MARGFPISAGASTLTDVFEVTTVSHTFDMYKMEIKGKIKTETSCTWEIDDFNSLSPSVGVAVRSPVFCARLQGKLCSSWYLTLYPNSDSKECEGNISLYLHPLPFAADELEVKYELYLIQQDNQRYRSHQIVTHTFHNSTALPGFGFSKLISRRNSLLRGGTLSVHCKIWDFRYRKTGTRELKCIAGINMVMWKQYLDQKFVDVTFSVMGETFMLHRNVVAANSPVFRAMFETEMQEAKHNMVTITDCNPEAFKEFVKFMYQGRVDDLAKFHCELLFIAEKYAVYDLKENCEKYMNSILSVENAINTLRLADLYSANWLKKKTLDFIKFNAQVVTNSSDMQILANDPKLVTEVVCALAAFVEEILL